MAKSLHEAAAEHLPPFITAPGQSDWLLVVMGGVLVLSVLAFGVFFFWLHSLPERMVHHKVQFDLVAVLGLLSLFTHIHAFWVAALILALIDLPNLQLSDYLGAMRRMATSLETMAGHRHHEAKPGSPVTAEPSIHAPSDATVDSALLSPPPQPSSEGTTMRETRHA